jgi:hypothetical protein
MAPNFGCTSAFLSFPPIPPPNTLLVMPSTLPPTALYLSRARFCALSLCRTPLRLSLLCLSVFPSLSGVRRVTGTHTHTHTHIHVYI